MFEAFRKFFAALSTLFSAAEKGAQSLDNIAAVGEMKSREWKNRQERELRALEKTMEKTSEKK